MTDSNGSDGSNGSSEAADAPKALATKGAKPHMGLLAAQADPAELQATVLTRRDAMFALAEDPSMPENARQAVRDLAALASPSKPGLEEMLMAWRPPRLMIAQPMTRSTAKPENAKNGDLFDTTGRLHAAPWTGTVIYIHEENINFKEGTKNPICSAPDAKLGSPFGECARCQYLPFGKQVRAKGEEQQITDCDNNIVAIMVPADLSNVYTVQFSKTSRKAGGALMQLAGAQRLVWAQSYQLSTEKKTNDSGMWWFFNVKPTGVNNPPHVAKLCEALYALYIAERKLMLHNHYSRPARAPQAAAEAEGQFASGAAALDAGLAGDAGGEEADLTTPVTPIATGGKPARTSHKPM
jgi:hypothetical protein